MKSIHDASMVIQSGMFIIAGEAAWSLMIVDSVLVIYLLVSPCIQMIEIYQTPNILEMGWMWIYALGKEKYL